jgi:hypothetical protein
MGKVANRNGRVFGHGGDRNWSLGDGHIHLGPTLAERASREQAQGAYASPRVRIFETMDDALQWSEDEHLQGYEESRAFSISGQGRAIPSVSAILRWVGRPAPRVRTRPAGCCFGTPSAAARLLPSLTHSLCGRGRYCLSSEQWTVTELVGGHALGSTHRGRRRSRHLSEASIEEEEEEPLPADDQLLQCLAEAESSMGVYFVMQTLPKGSKLFQSGDRSGSTRPTRDAKSGLRITAVWHGGDRKWLLKTDESQTYAAYV